MNKGEIKRLVVVSFLILSSIGTLWFLMDKEIIPSVDSEKIVTEPLTSEDTTSPVDAPSEPSNDPLPPVVEEPGLPVQRPSEQPVEPNVDDNSDNYYEDGYHDFEHFSEEVPLEEQLTEAQVDSLTDFAVEAAVNLYSVSALESDGDRKKRLLKYFLPDNIFLNEHFMSNEAAAMGDNESMEIIANISTIVPVLYSQNEVKLILTIDLNLILTDETKPLIVPGVEEVIIVLKPTNEEWKVDDFQVGERSILWVD